MPCAQLETRLPMSVGKKLKTRKPCREANAVLTQTLKPSLMSRRFRPDPPRRIRPCYKAVRFFLRTTLSASFEAASFKTRLRDGLQLHTHVFDVYIDAEANVVGEIPS